VKVAKKNRDLWSTY